MKNDGYYGYNNKKSNNNDVNDKDNFNNDNKDNNNNTKVVMFNSVSNNKCDYILLLKTLVIIQTILQN